MKHKILIRSAENEVIKFIIKWNICTEKLKVKFGMIFTLSTLEHDDTYYKQISICAIHNKNGMNLFYILRS